MKTGFLIESLGLSQLGVLMARNLNKLVSDRGDISPYVFYEDYDKLPETPWFPIMQNCYAWDFRGILISTSIKTTRIAQTIVGPSKRLFYVWNLEWLYTQKSFQEFSQVYQDDNIDLIARSVSHAELLSKLWKTPAHILEDFDHEQLTKIIDQYAR